MSVKPCSSNSEHSHSADSTSASAVALPYLASSRLSSEPALTPILIGTPRVGRRPGDLADLVVERLDVARVDPHRGAAGVDRGEHVLGLEVDVGDDRDLRLARDLPAARRRRPGTGTATRTIWQPVAVSSAICCSVAFTSAVSVVVIDCTDTGAPPPTGTACLPLPTMIWRDLRRGASGCAGRLGHAKV